MPSSFEEVRIVWNGKQYSIKPDQMMRCIAAVEDVITLAELYRFSSRETLPYGKVAMALGVILRFAGAQVEDSEIYSGMFKTQGEDVKTIAVDAVQKILALMIPPEHLRKAASPEEETAGKDAAGATAL